MNDPDWSLLPDDPLGFFGLDPEYDRRALRRAYGELARRFKPDRDPRRFMALRAAFEELLEALEHDAPTLPTRAPRSAPEPEHNAEPEPDPLLAVLAADAEHPGAPLCGADPATLESRLVEALGQHPQSHTLARALGHLNRRQPSVPDLLRAYANQRSLPEGTQFPCLRPILLELVRRRAPEELIQILHDLSRAPTRADQQLGRAAIEWVLPAACLHFEPEPLRRLWEFATQMSDAYESRSVRLAESIEELQLDLDVPRSGVEHRAIEALRDTWLGEWADERGHVARLFQELEQNPRPLLALRPRDPRALGLCHLLETYCGDGLTAEFDDPAVEVRLARRLEAQFEGLNDRSNETLLGFLWNDGTAMLLLPGLLLGPLLLSPALAWCIHADHPILAGVLALLSLLLSVLLLAFLKHASDRLLTRRVYDKLLREPLLELARSSPLGIDDLIAFARTRDIPLLQSESVLDLAAEDPALRLAYLASRHAP